MATRSFHGWAILIDNTLPSGEWWIALLGCVVHWRRQCSLGNLNQCCSKKMIMLKKMLNWPKIVNSISTKVLLWFFPPVCLLPHSYFLKQVGDIWAHFTLITFHIITFIVALYMNSYRLIYMHDMTILINAPFITIFNFNLIILFFTWLCLSHLLNLTHS